MHLIYGTGFCRIFATVRMNFGIISIHGNDFKLWLFGQYGHYTMVKWLNSELRLHCFLLARVNDS